MVMTSKQRMLTAIRGRNPRSPAGDHAFPHAAFSERIHGRHVGGRVLRQCGWDPITYTTPHRPDLAGGEYYDPTAGRRPAFSRAGGSPRDHWRVHVRAGRRPEPNPTTRYHFVTPKGTLTWCWPAILSRPGSSNH